MHLQANCQGTQNGTEILVGQAVFKLWIKATLEHLVL